MNIISRVNELSCIDFRQQHANYAIWYGNQVFMLQQRLENLTQSIIVLNDEKTGNVDCDRILRTAELYRIGALVYLHRLPYQPSTIPISDADQHLVDRALQLLDQLQVCTSPWPLFMVASGVTTEEQRADILAIFDIMQEKRRIGNVDAIRKIIEDLWIQTDLAADEPTRPRVEWRQLVDPKQLPSFI